MYVCEIGVLSHASCGLFRCRALVIMKTWLPVETQWGTGGFQH